jgi:hypothetical protein
MSTIEAGQIFGRIYFGRHPDPLGYVKTPSRFSDPRRRIPEHRFGVLYLGASVKVCFLEAVLRDKRNGAIRDHPMGEVELRARRYAEIEVVEPLRLVDLRGDGPVRMGNPIGGSAMLSSFALTRLIACVPRTPGSSGRNHLPVAPQRRNKSGNI